MRTGVDKFFRNLRHEPDAHKPLNEFSKGACQRDRFPVRSNFLRRRDLGQGVDYGSLQQNIALPELTVIISIISGASSGAKSFKTLFSIIPGPTAFPTFRLDKESCTAP